MPAISNTFCVHAQPQPSDYDEPEPESESESESESEVSPVVYMVISSSESEASPVVKMVISSESEGEEMLAKLEAVLEPELEKEECFISSSEEESVLEPDPELEDCPICLSPCEDAGVISCPCVVKVCYDCLVGWVEETNKCPMCRTRITRIESSQGRETIHIAEDRERVLADDLHSPPPNPDTHVSDLEVDCLGQFCKWRNGEIDALDDSARFDLLCDDVSIQCDSCSVWFHCPCVGVLDSRSIHETEEWRCPVCSGEYEWLESQEGLDLSGRVRGGEEDEPEEPVVAEVEQTPVKFPKASAAAKAREAAYTSEQRAERAAKHSASMKAQWEDRTAEQRAKIAAKTSATKNAHTPEQRAKIAAKKSETTKALPRVACPICQKEYSYKSSLIKHELQCRLLVKAEEEAVTTAQEADILIHITELEKLMGKMDM